MSTENTTAATDSGEAGVVAKLSTLDRFLPIWILAAMVVGPARRPADPRAR